MLIGTAILTTLDVLAASNLFNPDSPIRNIGFITGLLLEFALAFEETCEGDEDGWRFVVLRMLDRKGIEVRGTDRVLSIIKGLRSIALAETVSVQQKWSLEEDETKEQRRDEGRDGDGKDINERVGQVADKKDDKDAKKKVPNFINAYRPDSDPQAECRDWDLWDWKAEVIFP